VSLHKKLGFAGLIAFLFAGPCLAQGLGVGATIGAVNDVGGKFHIDEFKPKDLNVWVDYETQEKVLVRATLGTLRLKGVNAGKAVSLVPGGPPVTLLPDLTNHIDYATLGVSYLFAEAGYTSGIFAGFGGYKIRPDSVANDIANYRDQPETAFGWHAGIEGGVQLVSRLSLMLRLTYHNIRSEAGRSILTANAGLGYRF
jgi:Outer membrane protein beta-barrel domain